MITPARILTAFLLAVPLLLAAPPAFALVTVGPASGGCRFQKLQDAIDYVLAYERNGFGTGTPQFDDPYIAVTAGFYIEELSVDGTGISDPRPGQFGQGALIYILGGYNPATCDNPRDPSFAVTLNSGGRSGASTLKISGNSRVYLDLVTVSGANGGNGGGISFSGSGLLDLTTVAVVENNAVNGAGVYANGQAPGIDIVLHHDTLFELNIAGFSGGAFRLEGISHLVAAEDQTLFYGNSAGTTGGALSLSGYQTAADIGSAGYSGLPVIYNNSAELGGGVSATAAGTLRLWRTAGRGRTGIVSNHATVFGGGVYLDGISNERFSKMCAFGFRIDGNTAPYGAAVYGDGGSTIGMNEDDFEIDYGEGICGSEAPLPSVADISCVPDGAGCNSVSGNTASEGAIVVSQGLIGELVEFRGNSGARALSGGSYVTNCVIAGNTFTQDVVSTPYFRQCTLAGNSLPAGMPVISGSTTTVLAQSIVWQPGNRTFDPAANLTNMEVVDVIASDSDLFNGAGFGVFRNVHSYNPAFVSPATGDFHLKPESPAVDYAVFDLPTSPDDDFDGNSRPVVLTHAATPLDLGAYELQSLGDVIFSGEFDRGP